jgi:hypothetical protein
VPDRSRQPAALLSHAGKGGSDRDAEGFQLDHAASLRHPSGREPPNFLLIVEPPGSRRVDPVEG